MSVTTARAIQITELLFRYCFGSDGVFPFIDLYTKHAILQDQTIEKYRKPARQTTRNIGESFAIIPMSKVQIKTDVLTSKSEIVRITIIFRLVGFLFIW